MSLFEILVNGAELHYLDHGHGQPLVLIHGSLGDYRSWAFQMEPFAQHYRVIAYSRRYHFPNGWAGDGLDYSAALHAEDLAGLIHALELGAVHLVASSYGAYTALVFAAGYPGLARSLVLGEPPLVPWLETIPGGAPLRAGFSVGSWGPARQAFQRGDAQRGVQLFLDGVMGAGTFAGLSPAARTMLMDNAREMRAETTAPAYFSPFTCTDAGRIQSPALLLTGERSLRLFHLITDELERCLPHGQRVTIPGASHAMQVGNPRAYNEAVLGFLANQP